MYNVSCYYISKTEIRVTLSWQGHCTESVSNVGKNKIKRSAAGQSQCYAIVSSKSHVFRRQKWWCIPDGWWGTVPSSLSLCWQIPVFYRGGFVIPLRERVRRASILAAQDPYTLLIALNASVRGGILLHPWYYSSLSCQYLWGTMTGELRLLSTTPLYKLYVLTYVINVAHWITTNYTAKAPTYIALWTPPPQSTLNNMGRSSQGIG